jgi:hypothetical protein
MNFFEKNKTIIIGVAIIVLLFLGYTFFFSNNNPEDVLVSNSQAGVTESAGSTELLSLLLELKSISLNTELFDSGVFRSLKDSAVDIVPQPVGRSNPFAPIGVGGPPSGSASALNEQSDTDISSPDSPNESL